MNGRLTIFCCDPWESYMGQLEAETEQAQWEYELELDLRIAARRRNRRPLRTWHALIPAELVSSWDAYRGAPPCE